VTRLVVIESPFAGKGPTPEEIAIDAGRKRRYLLACLRDSLLRGESPFASHGLYPGALDDNNPRERELGMSAGFAWRERAELTAVYVDLGYSAGMIAGIEHAHRVGCAVEERWLGPGWGDDKERRTP
jgi:hypothetical protein